MSLNFKKLATEHDDLKFIKALYCTSVKDLLDMDKDLIGDFVIKTEALCHWLRGLQKLAQKLDKKGN